MITIYHSTARSRALTVIDKSRTGAWVSLVAPSNDELVNIAEQHNLEVDLLNDALDLYEAPRIETDEGNVYIYTRYAFPEGKEIATEPLLIIYTPNNLITVMRQKTEVLNLILNGKIEVLTTQKTKTLMQILTELNRTFELQLRKVSKQTLRIRAQMRQSELSSRDFIGIIEIEEDLNEYVTALLPQEAVLSSLVHGKHIRLYEDDKDIIEDLTLSAVELIEMAKSRALSLANIRQAYDAIATTNLNQTFKRLTSIAIFFSIPTIVGGLWGMNVAVPRADDPRAFWMVLALIATIMSVAVYVFHRKRWL